jgi:hypothetical protein
MAFDALAPSADLAALSPAALIDAAQAPAADWAEANADRFLAFLYVSPQPCEGLDRLTA